MDKQLQSDVAGKYQVLEGHGVGEYHFNGHPVHLDAINLEEADKLVENGFPYLVPAAAPKKPKALPTA